MTFFYFVNCCALTYGPYIMLYKKSILSEYSPYRRCVSIGSIYLMTTLIRMFLLGTLVPLVSLDSAARDIFQSLVNIIDLFGIYHAINQTVGKPEIKILSVLVGWGLSESVLSTLLVYWNGARQYEFSWEYAMLAVEQNINILQLAATIILVWLWTRQDLSSNMVPIVSSVLLFSLLKSFFVKILLGSGAAIWGNLIATGAISTFAFSLFLSITAAK
jgi:hypothetical protein